MDKIDQLLEKYFGGRSTLTEENELKAYFNNREIKEEHQVYRALFGAFSEELSLKAATPLKRVFDRRKKTKTFWLKTFSYSGAAALVVLTLWLQIPRQPANYAVISGTVIEDSDYAQKYAEKKLNKANEILKNGMKSMQKFDNVRNCLEPIQKISDTRLKIDEIQEKLQIK